MAGILVSDEKWNKTEREVRAVIQQHCESDLPPRFELHAHELLSPKGDGHFSQMDRDGRNSFALGLLNLIGERGHQVLLQPIDKRRLAKSSPPALDLGITWDDPWKIAFGSLMTMAEVYLRGKQTGSSSSGIIIIDHEPSYLEEARAQSRTRRAAKGWAQTRKIVDIGYSAASHENTMIQLADLVAFTMKKWEESRTEQGEGWPREARSFFQDCRDSMAACSVQDPQVRGQQRRGTRHVHRVPQADPPIVRVRGWVLGDAVTRPHWGTDGRRPTP